MNVKIKPSVYVLGYNERTDVIADHIATHLTYKDINLHVFEEVTYYPYEPRFDEERRNRRLSAIACSTIFVLVYDRDIIDKLLEKDSQLLAEFIEAEKARQDRDNYFIFTVPLDGVNGSKDVMEKLKEILELEFLKNGIYDKNWENAWFSDDKSFSYISAVPYIKYFYEHINCSISFPLLKERTLGKECLFLINYFERVKQGYENLLSNLAHSYFVDFKELPRLYEEKKVKASNLIERFEKYERFGEEKDLYSYAIDNISKDSVKEKEMRFFALANIFKEIQDDIISSIQNDEKPYYSRILDSNFSIKDYATKRLYSKKIRFAPLEKTVYNYHYSQVRVEEEKELMEGNHSGYTLGELHFSGFEAINTGTESEENVKLLDWNDLCITFTPFFNHDAIPSAYIENPKHLAEIIKHNYIDTISNHQVAIQGFGVSIVTVSYKDGTEERYYKNNFLKDCRGGVTIPLITKNDVDKKREIATISVQILYSINKRKHVWQLDHKFIFEDND